MYGAQPWFGGNSGVAIDNKMQDAELRYQLRRLSAHPCVFIWDACNECGGKGTCKSSCENIVHEQYAVSCHVWVLLNR